MSARRIAHLESQLAGCLTSEGKAAKGYGTRVKAIQVELAHLSNGGIRRAVDAPTPAPQRTPPAATPSGSLLKDMAAGNPRVVYRTHSG